MKKLIFVAVVFFIGSIYGQSTPLITNSSFPVNTASQLRTSGGKNLDDGLRDLTNQIVTSMVTGKKKKIAVVEFSDLDGNVTEFGKYLAEELITRLFQTTMFNVIERRLLNKVAQEQQLSLKGIIDESSAKALGRILGVDAIVSGTITDLGTSLRINARIISTETGSIFAAAVTEINKNATVRKLLDSAPTREAVDKPKPKEEEETEDKSRPENAIEGNKIFFKEDFSIVEEGMVPENWLGTENVMVYKSKRGKKYLANFQQRGAKLIIPRISLPNNWKIIIISTGMGYDRSIKCKLGNLKFGYNDRPDRVYINNTRGGSKLSRDKIYTLELEKKGTLFRLFVDGTREVLVRYPQFEPADQMVVEYTLYFRLYSIEGKIIK